MTASGPSVSSRADLVEPFLSGQRWFGGKGRPFRVSAVHRVGAVPASADPLPPVVYLAVVEYADPEGGSELYQLPLALYERPEERLSHAHLGLWEDEQFGSVHAYDAVHDRSAMACWLRAFVDPAAGAGAGPLSFHSLPSLELDPEALSTPFTGEQSNSTVLFGEECLLKLFRRLTPGRNPDIEIHERLTRAGSDHIARLYGWVETSVPADGASTNGASTNGEVVQLGMLQELLRTASDGWDLAQASVRNLFAEADLHAEEVGGDFAGESARLGEAVAAVHRDLREQFGTGTVDLGFVADQMTERLEAAVAAVPELADHAPNLRSLFDRLADLGTAPVQRVHGDLHLGQTLRTVHGWKLVDFEGEPAKSLAERSQPDSVWRDVAGMVRSFDYAARVVERTMGADSPASANQLAFRGDEWVGLNGDAFVTSYVGDRAVTDTERVLLAAYLADKAVYEAVYEARNRPAWVDIPLSAITTLTIQQSEV
ncbi:MAG: hypothetical protein QM714_07220 [Nocardioides sp.]|uniref:maltokinase N-terminal cap-like domain-containing protein n=1 Tax=Nocardioides sp. TaxID=35761 RepID=UPI0039E588BE